MKAKEEGSDTDVAGSGNEENKRKKESEKKE